jgi:hypothetical protein
METVQFAGWIRQGYQKRLSGLHLLVALEAKRQQKTGNVNGLGSHVAKYSLNFTDRMITLCTLQFNIN